jgi:Skp family chaperone for outer membrane proteins
MRNVINETGRKEGFTMILQRGAAGLIYTREALDITDLIVSKYNEG